MRLLKGVDIPSGSRPKTIPLITLLEFRLPPIILTTRMLSTLKLIGLGGMIDVTASATSEDRRSSDPYCLEAMAGVRAVTRDSVVNGFDNVLIESSGSLKNQRCLRLHEGEVHTFEFL